MAPDTHESFLKWREEYAESKAREARLEVVRRVREAWEHTPEEEMLAKRDNAIWRVCDAIAAEDRPPAMAESPIDDPGSML